MSPEYRPPQPIGQNQGEQSTTAENAFALLGRRNNLHLPTPVGMYDLLMDTMGEASWELSVFRDPGLLNDTGDEDLWKRFLFTNVLEDEANWEQADNQIDTLAHVTTAYGFLVYDHMQPSKQAIFLRGVNRQRLSNEDRIAAGEEIDPETLQLTQQEADILRDVASAVNIAYDPGDETTPEKRAFRFSDVINKAPTKREVGIIWSRLLDELPPNPNIVESD